MEGILDPVARWLGEAASIPVLDAASVSLVRDRVREVGARVGLPDVATAALVTAASELAQNHLAHAVGGRVVVREHVRGQERGVEVVAADRGPGIPDVARALSGQRSSPASLGAGLAAVLELSDEVDLDVRLGEGMCVWARKFAARGVRRKRIGVYGRALPGESVSGDDAGFVRTPTSLSFAVIDGLGHGPAAREASARARTVVVRSAGLEPDALVAACDRELRGTRGAVMVVGRVDDDTRLSITAVGDAAAHAYGPRGTTRFGGSAFVVGAPGGTRRVNPERRALEPRDVVVLFTDGITSRLDLAQDFDLLREHPIVVAQRVVERFARANDDVLVMAVG